MPRAYSDQLTQVQYNRHLAAYYRQQIVALQQGLPRWPSQLLPATSEQDSIDRIASIEPLIIVDDPIAALDFPSQQEPQRSTSSSSSIYPCSPPDKDITVTLRERTESYESERSVSVGTSDSAGSSKPASPMAGRMMRMGMVTASTPVPVVKAVRSKPRAKSGVKGLSRIFRRRRGGDE
ncbi:hypothetical protein B0A54_17440 [Friedmanniomyces endolithicus]|uniref:Uncharacterized protein n=1 Tax=Friedmanniomyces endolithicus TaxID=329885 RepID=A0A4V5N3M8_9PEZI|nr:hypothetical protein LTS09_017268 [Friedmanniomyces endolithicus]TKA24279.1 hypothetical protein B0A54_17440 [Friedmanniomyces endolithicus]